jgi:hypothetical protein
MVAECDVLSSRGIFTVVSVSRDMHIRIAVTVIPIGLSIAKPS